MRRDPHRSTPAGRPVSPRHVVCPRVSRRGAALLETAIVLAMLLLLTLGVFDLGIGIFRYHRLSEAARHGARQAIVRGERASTLGSWGPDTIVSTAANGAIPIVASIEPLLTGCDPTETTIRVEWLNNSNATDDPVRVTIETPYRPVVLQMLLPGSSTAVDLRASSTMLIAH